MGMATVIGDRVNADEMGTSARFDPLGVPFLPLRHSNKINNLGELFSGIQGVFQGDVALPAIKRRFEDHAPLPGVFLRHFGSQYRYGKILPTEYRCSALRITKSTFVRQPRAPPHTGAVNISDGVISDGAEAGRKLGDVRYAPRAPTFRESREMTQWAQELTHAPQQFQQIQRGKGP